MLLGPRLSSSCLSLSSSSRERKKKNSNNNIINNNSNINMVPQQRPILDLDGLYCEEENLDGDLLDSENGFLGSDQNVKEPVFPSKNMIDSENGFLGFNKNGKDCVFSSKKEVDWGDDELNSLFIKEKCLLYGENELFSNGLSMVDREGAVEWMLRVVSHYGFSVLTTVLAANYFDRFSVSASFQIDKLWMSQLAAVACLSLAAKVEETQVPLLIDLQVEGAKYVFEAKTIMRMELLVLSTLGWKMNPVTPLSFVDYVIRRLGMKNHLRSRFLGRCERVLMSVITDPKYGSFLPSLLAAGTMLYVLKEVEPDNVLDCQTELLHVLEMNMDKVDECYEFISDLQASYETNKRKYMSAPNSPNGVIDAYFSSDSSNDSWIVAPVDATSSPELPFKRSRSNDQQMRVTLSRHL